MNYHHNPHRADATPRLPARLWQRFFPIVTGAACIVAASLAVLPAAHAGAPPTISTIAGNGHGPSSGDGGPAIDARFMFTSSVATDSVGNLYILDTQVRKVSGGIITAYAGNGTNGYSGDGGPALDAAISGLNIAIDAQDNLYISGNNRIRKVTPAGIISTIAGNGTAGFSGDGGPAIAAMLGNPRGIAIDAAGNVYVADSDNCRIRMISPDGKIQTVAGNGAPAMGGDGGPALDASLQFPLGVAVDAAGNIFISDTFNRRIRKVSANGIISTIAGTGAGYFNGDGQPATTATLGLPINIKVDAGGTVYIADSGNNRLRAIKPDGTIITIAGNGLPGYTGDNGPAADATLEYLNDMTLDEHGDINLADLGKIRHVIMVPVPPDPPTITQITPGFGRVTVTLAPPLDDGGSRIIGYIVQCMGAATYTDASSNVITVRFLPPGVPVSCVATAENAAGRSLPSAPSDTVTPLEPPHTVPGAPTGVMLTLNGFDQVILNFVAPADDGGSPLVSYLIECGDSITPVTIGTNTQTYLALPPAAPISCTVRAKNVYGLGPASAPSNVITPIVGTYTQSEPPVIGTATAGINSARVAFTPPAHTGYGPISLYTATCGNASASRSASPITVSGLTAGVAVTCVVTATNAYGPSARSAPSNSVVPLGGPRLVTIAGSGLASVNGNGGPAFNADMNTPKGLALDADGNLYIADSKNARIRKVTPRGLLTSLPVNGQAGVPSPSSPAAEIFLSTPWAVAFDDQGNLLVADALSGLVLKITAQNTMSVFAGSSTSTLRGDGGAALNAKLASPRGLAVDGAGNVYIADWLDMRIRKVAPDGSISTYAGNGAAEFSGDGGPAINAGLNHPAGLAVDAAGNLYIADMGNGRVRKVTPGGAISTVVGGGTQPWCADDGAAADACLAGPSAVALDGDGNLYIAEADGARVRKLATDGSIGTVANIDGPSSLLLDGAGNLLVSDGGHHVQKVVFTGAVPDAPTAVVATAQAGGLSVDFTPPANAGSSGITGYFALCDPFYGYAESTPIVVAMPFGPPVPCNVRAVNSIGPGTPSAASASVSSLPPANSSLKLVSVRSRKNHGTAGPFDLPLIDRVSVEPRIIGAGHVIIFEFNEPVTDFAGTSVLDTKDLSFINSFMTYSGNEITVTLPSVANASQVNIYVWNVNNKMNASITLGFLLGDVNNSRTVNADDRNLIKNHAGQAVNDSNFQYDINATGVISAADVSLVKVRKGTALP